MTNPVEPKHNLATRLFHAGLALAVIVQLLSSLTMKAPSPRGAGNVLFTLHQYSGLAAFVIVLGFWIAVTVRKRGTEWGLLLPWASPARLAALWADIRLHLGALAKLRMPAFDQHSPLASAVHGLGLLLMLAMASTGTVYYFINSGNPDAGGLVGVVMFIHKTLANLVWAYLIGHAGLAVIHHFTKHMSLTEMWSFAPVHNSKEPAE